MANKSCLLTLALFTAFLNEGCSVIPRPFSSLTIPSGIPPCDGRGVASKDDPNFATIHITREGSAEGLIQAIDLQPPNYLSGSLCNPEIIRLSPGLHIIHVNFTANTGRRFWNGIGRLAFEAKAGRSYDITYQYGWFFDPDLESERCTVTDVDSGEVVFDRGRQCGSNVWVGERRNERIWAEELLQVYGGRGNYRADYTGDRMAERLRRLQSCLEFQQQGGKLEERPWCSAPFEEYSQVSALYRQTDANDGN